jgi:hypothetical protein
MEAVEAPAARMETILLQHPLQMDLGAPTVAQVADQAQAKNQVTVALVL